MVEHDEVDERRGIPEIEEGGERKQRKNEEGSKWEFWGGTGG